MPDFLNSLRMAFGFLTVLPIPQKKEFNNRDFGWSALFYPLVGAFIGAVTGYACRFLCGIFQRPLGAFLTLVVWIFLSGGLHWDGLADCFDGFCCSTSAERRLQIMKDSRLGTYGALGVFCALIVKWLCIWPLPLKSVPLFFALAGASSRWAILFLVHQPLANPTGYAALLKTNCPQLAPLYAAPLPLILAFLFAGWGGLIYLGVNLLWIMLLTLLARVKIEGVNGDVMGFGIEMGEIVILLAGQVLL